MFDINKIIGQKKENNRYSRRIGILSSQGINTKYIEKSVSEAANNVNSNIRSFVIYGDPQSGKTEMMISLSARLLDLGNKIIIILIKDDVELLNQNLGRFAESGIDPAPCSFAEILDPDVKISNKEWIIFCKKNPHDLEKLNQKIVTEKSKIIIDDEADYATPNPKVNKNDITTINRLVGELLGATGIYIGVTATPARLDLNNTFENANEKWINFQAHDNYTGQDAFFPIDLSSPLKYHLETLPDIYDSPSSLRNALFSFFVNVAYLNCEVNDRETNYCMLVHTSGKKVDHTMDYKNIINSFGVLENQNDANFSRYVKQIWEIAKGRYKTTGIADKITLYIINNIARHKVVVMNSETDKAIDFSLATNPVCVFTIAIGGNIVSRGVTFNNLLSMFFTRDAKHKIQQDTYIQRARMFGVRGKYLTYFELTIPEKLYLDWHRCFVFHRLSLESIKNGNAPVWLEDNRIQSVSPSSINHTMVAMDSGQMSFDIFDYDASIENLIEDNSKKSFEKLKILQNQVTKEKLPDYLISFIEHFSPDGNNSLAIHKSSDISNWNDVDKVNIYRSRGLIGGHDRETTKYPHAIHHIKIFFNQNKKARVCYMYDENIKFLKKIKMA
jgi:hypothetical protein